MDLEKTFSEAVEKTRHLNHRPSNTTLLRLYALYRQVTTGDVPDGPHKITGDPKVMAKYEAWKSLKGMSREECMREYVELIQSFE